MSKSAAMIYLLWSFMLIGAGIWIFSKMTDKNNPNSFISTINQLEEAMDEDSQVP